MSRVTRSASSSWPCRDSQRGHVAPHEQDPEAHRRGEAEAQAPADVLAEQRLVEQQERRRRAEDRADPVGADDQVHGPAQARGNQLVDGRVDRRVLAADARAGHEAAGGM
jgi:hypothetical protein